MLSFLNNLFTIIFSEIQLLVLEYFWGIQPIGRVTNLRLFLLICEKRFDMLTLSHVIFFLLLCLHYSGQRHVSRRTAASHLWSYPIGRSALTWRLLLSINLWRFWIVFLSKRHSFKCFQFHKLLWYFLRSLIEWASSTYLLNPSFHHYKIFLP